jgi:hypothetical protein
MNKIELQSVQFNVSVQLWEFVKRNSESYEEFVFGYS